MSTIWEHKKFDELSAIELYNIIKLRNEIFIVEQNCVYMDADGKDPEAIHLCGFSEQNLVAYARLFAPGSFYPQASIGRVLTNPRFRRKGLGIALMKNAIELTCNTFNTTHICIGAQLYLFKFYSNLGFLPKGETYLEDGIPHVEMHYIR